MKEEENKKKRDQNAVDGHREVQQNKPSVQNQVIQKENQSNEANANHQQHSAKSQKEGGPITSQIKETKISENSQGKELQQSITINEKEGWKTQRKRQFKGQNNKKQNQTFIPKQVTESQKVSENSQVETQIDTQAQSSRENQHQRKETTTPQKQYPVNAPTAT
ncbi:uncharacterized protein [Nicotiana tomentosiformis]|uniref:uncharacterized protein n=1 Tax=Nicotiana tomentosiformis TaxID=4098 RepID=UPI00388C8FEB